MAVFQILLLLGLLCLCSGFISNEPCPTLEHSDPIAFYEHKISNNAFYSFAFKTDGSASYENVYRKTPPLNTMKRYIYTRDTDLYLHCNLTSSEALNSTNGYLLEIGTQLLDEVELLLPYLECNQSVMNKTRLWYYHDVLFFWWCFQPNTSTSIQNWATFVPTLQKNEISLETDKKKIRQILKELETLVGFYAIYRLVVNFIPTTKFDWKAIYTPQLQEKAAAAPQNTMNIIVIICFIVVFRIFKV